MSNKTLKFSTTKNDLKIVKNMMEMLSTTTTKQFVLSKKKNNDKTNEQLKSKPSNQCFVVMKYEVNLNLFA